MVRITQKEIDLILEKFPSNINTSVKESSNEDEPITTVISEQQIDSAEKEDAEAEVEDSVFVKRK